jgi:hypothetical protein
MIHPLRFQSSVCALRSSVSPNLQALNSQPSIFSRDTPTRYPGFDLADDDWPALLILLTDVQKYVTQLESRLRAQ